MTLQNLAVTVGAALRSACTSSSQPAVHAVLADTGQPTLHAVNDTRLRVRMDQMDALMFERFEPQAEIDRERRIYAQKTADTADKLGSAVDAILSRLPALNLNPDEQLTFRALTGKLREQAHGLNAQAKLNRIVTIEPMLDR